ncbi:hypothetical protein MYCTH_37027, partial [Thermothelomyces thermophilus ATCC 42464]
QREYPCGHFRWTALNWCESYKGGQKRCEPNVIDFEERPGVCGECKEKKWEDWE